MFASCRSKNTCLLAVLLLPLLLCSCSKHQLRNKYDVSESSLADKGSVDKLVSALDDPSSSLRAWAAVYLIKMGSAAHQALPKLKSIAENGVLPPFLRTV